MKIKSVALLMLIWFTGQNMTVLAGAFMSAGPADAAVGHAAHCATEPSSTYEAQQNSTEAGVVNPCGLDCQCCASCSSFLAGNSALATASGYCRTPDTPYKRASLTATIYSLFRPPISA